MNDPNVERSDMETTFGLSIDEVFNGHQAATTFLGSDRVQSALRLLETEAPRAASYIYDMLVARSLSGAFAAAGQGLAVYFSQPEFTPGRSWLSLLENVMAPPPTHADTADWWLLFSTLNAAVEFQLTHISPPKTEQILSGNLIADLKHYGAIWADLLAPMLKRRGSTLAFHQIDLERLGGEQATGGDFGLVLDFDGRTAQPGDQSAHTGRIVPLVFQAKRFTRPSADVSQAHKKRGPQKDMLRKNVAASAYVLYENGNDKIVDPLPVLVKPIGNVGPGRTTSALEGTVDLATYLYRASVDEEFAPRAHSVQEALAMIYAGAKRDQLSHLVVASGSRNARLRYQAAIDHIAAYYGPETDDPDESPEDDDGRVRGIRPK